MSIHGGTQANGQIHNATDVMHQAPRPLVDNRLYSIYGLLPSEVHVKEDMQRVLCAGLWVIFRTYLHVELWNNKFDPATKLIKLTVVWAKLPGLPVHYCNQSFLKRVGQALGKERHSISRLWRGNGGDPLVGRSNKGKLLTLTAAESGGSHMSTKPQRKRVLEPARGRTKAPVDPTHVVVKPSKAFVQSLKLDVIQSLIEEEDDAQNTDKGIDGDVADRRKGGEDAFAPVPSVLGMRTSGSHDSQAKKQEGKKGEATVHKSQPTNTITIRPTPSSSVNKNREEACIVMEKEFDQPDQIRDDIPPDPHQGATPPLAIQAMHVEAGPLMESCLMDEDSVDQSVEEEKQAEQEDGRILEEQEELRVMAETFFKQLYAAPIEPGGSMMWVEDEEIVEALKEMAQLKANKPLLKNLMKSGPGVRESWVRIFGVTLWKVWKWRNDLVFSNLDLPIGLKLGESQRKVEEISSESLWSKSDENHVAFHGGSPSEGNELILHSRFAMPSLLCRPIKEERMDLDYLCDRELVQESYDQGDENVINFGVQTKGDEDLMEISAEEYQESLILCGP
ncbi:OLC1v1030330C1 [Oldenlandia corymbosa var. corymbosa]|uniref:OLC1v1030330C1 n=1 Tax=Oldenlandia corymbosa var. corymbosa TaxID=529605 RepID=A0AAV1CGJ5_OLDCO|nr:OLC1v1030330C1 [Oldenlandia corymbosa var. corymbosa]